MRRQKNQGKKIVPSMTKKFEEQVKLNKAARLKRRREEERRENDRRMRSKRQKEVNSVISNPEINRL
jgi:hypothetical protein